MKLSQKQIGAILYVFYLDNYCEDDFCFDNGETTTKVKAYYESLPFSEDELAEIEENINVEECEGSDYDWMKFTYGDSDELYLQVTSMFDYNDEPVAGYDGDSCWCDVGMFWLDNSVVNFEDLKD